MDLKMPKTVKYKPNIFSILEDIVTETSDSELIPELKSVCFIDIQLE